ncbi:MAG: hypothetical protein P1P69_01600 [Methanosarcinaceae archaeon]|nr:hypothetical protein [Methanosarcinaceae archaeon]MDF1533182.1 hypothetical protein [Methanosarcinaceae archaeon]
MRVLINSSTLIALAKIGKLNTLRKVFKTVYITTKIQEEILNDECPETDVFMVAIDEWIKVLNYEGDAKSLKKYGLDQGETSLFLAARSDDIFVLDESNARRYAESNGYEFTGLVGFIVAAAKSRMITKEDALEILNKLVKGDFRMSAEIYLWAIENIKD